METIFKRKVVTRQAIVNALHEFDRQAPDSGPHAEWLSKANFKFAVLYDGRKYPPKLILSMASGIPVTDFNGGEQANNVFKKLGFQVVDK